MPKRKVQLNAGDLILNSPFQEPSRYWSYDRKHRVFTEIHGRRPAGYVVATPNAQGFDDPGQFIELDLVNQIRPRVQAWRDANYPHVTGITRRLLEHWNDPDQREGRRFFFCQMEAIETLIWLTEAAPAERSGIVIPSDGGPFTRLCSKMATGSGKTIVMSMLIAWQVLNDEAHHAWRINPEVKVSGVDRADIDEATKWVGSLDRIHSTRGILKCFDLSATPFAPSGGKSNEDALFGWIVSDFGLNDAIESGLVKTPRVVVRDNGRLNKEYKSRFYHLYRDADVTDDINRRAQPHEPLPDIVTSAYTLLGQDWLETCIDWKNAGHPVPPVLITVANRTETAARIKYAFDHQKIHIPELCDPDKTLHIDSKVLDQAEAQETSAEVVTSSDSTEDDDDAPVKKLTKQQQAELLRKTVDTVGQVGKPGEAIQNVISVGMLSEGWDAKTVTHIMGLRAFSSQLLCEQVVGRGLRRTSYDLNPETGLFEPEYVNIFGVPFSFLPHEEGGDNPPPPPKPKTLIEPLQERESEFEISWPNVLRIEHVYSPQLRLNVADVPPLILNPNETPTNAELAAILEGKPNMDSLSKIDLEELGRKYRLQTIVFRMARDVFDQMQVTWQASKESLLAQVIRIVEEILRSDRVRCKTAGFDEELKRRVLLILNMNRIVHHIWEAIRFSNTTDLKPVYESQRPILSTSDMRPWYTSRPCERTKRSHLSHAVYDSTWEATEAYELDNNDFVASWVKNDHLGFEILYVFRGAVRKYRPDFLIRLTNGKMLILEVKGVESDESKAKHQFAGEWIKAVNSDGRFGIWRFAVSTDPADLAAKLAM